MEKGTVFEEEVQKIYVGIDVHKKSWAVSLYSDSLYLKSFTQPPEPEKLISYLRRNYPGCIYYAVYEAGFCGYWIHDRLSAGGIRCFVTHPGDIPTTDKERRHKTDKQDSLKLGRELQKGSLMPIRVPSPERRDDRGLIRQREKAKIDLKRVKNRIKSFLAFRGIPLPVQYDRYYWSRSFLDWLNEVQLPRKSGQQAFSSLLRQYEFCYQEWIQLKRHIRDLSTCPEYADTVRYLCTIPGIGLLSAVLWATELGDMRDFRRFDDLCSYVGLVPREHSSGEKTRTGSLDKRGNKYLRTTLIECAWIAIRHDLRLLRTYERLIKQMKGEHAIIRIARKLLQNIRYVMINQCAYEIRA